jgi:hypothetical protein
MGTRRKLWAFAAISIAACSTQHLYATPPPGTQIDSFPQQSVPKTDILWVVGNNPWMSSAQAALALSFPKFFAHLQASNLDYRIAVTNSDIYATAGALVGSPKVIVGNSSDKNVADTANPQAAFESNIMVGTSGFPRPEALEAASMALNQLQAQATAAQTAGKSVLFLRPDAALFMIFVGDETDYSPDQPNYYWRTFLQAKGIGNNNLVQVSAIAGDVPDGCCPLDCCPPGCCTAGDTAEHCQQCCVSTNAGQEWCNGGGCCTNSVLPEQCSFAIAGTPYYEVVELAGGIYGSICSATFDDQLDQLGLQALGLQHKFYLSQSPTLAPDGGVATYSPCNNNANSVAGLCVEVDYPCSTDTNSLGPNQCTGNLQISCPSGYGPACDGGCSDTDIACNPPESSTNGWSYEQSDNALVFNGSDVPPLGAVIKVTYTLAGSVVP